MFGKKIDILAIGDTTTDAFIHLKDPHIHCTVDVHGEEICMPFGAKIPFESVTVIKAVGNAANAAVSAARLGLHSALLSNLGDDQNGRDCLVELNRNKVDISNVKVHKNKPSNYHFVLWYNIDRTILVNHVEYDYKLPKFQDPKWIYLTSLAPNARMYHGEIADYLEAHPDVKLAFQPGTFQIGLGVDELKRIYARTEVFIVNLEEAQTILQTDNRDIKVLMKKLASYGPKLVAITDGANGSYLYDGDHYYFMPMYPDPKTPLERTGCGDAWTSTFVSALAMGKSPLEALVWAPVNSMSVVQFIGAQEGLLTLEQLTWWLERAPADYKPKEI
ncbi:MAG: carbohydrate kinase family protein [Candidatus Taylorbacteria bacterium]